MYKKVWLYILIIVVVSSLFPSIIIAKADEGEGEYPDDDIPDLEFSLQDAPFPGTYEELTESGWQAFINRAESLGHNTIMQLVSYTEHYEDGGSKNISIDVPVFFSTDGTDVGTIVYLDDQRNTHPDKEYSYTAYLKHLPDTFPDMPENYNVIDRYGHNTYRAGAKTNWYIWQEDFGANKYTPKELLPENLVVNYNFHYVPWYSGEISSDPYQDIPERYNIDPQRGYGMSFLKPAFGDWINIPHKLGTYKDTIEIEIQIPKIYEASDGITYNMFNVSEGLGQMAIPNFAIRLYSHNVKKIEGSQVVGRDGIWILPNNIRFVEGFMDGSNMHSARFIASVPIEHAKPLDGSHCLIVADLVIHKTGGLENYSVEIPEARTWTKYLTYLGTVDSDGDGFDDRTGLPINDGGKPGESIKNDKPNRDDYEDGILGTISYYFDTLIYYAMLPFKYIGIALQSIIDWINNIGNFIDSFSSIFERLFSFLPSEVTAMLVLGFSTLMIITVVRAIRGS